MEKNEDELVQQTEVNFATVSLYRYQGSYENRIWGGHRSGQQIRDRTLIDAKITHEKLVKELSESIKRGLR
jgi:hypothetical protein